MKYRWLHISDLHSLCSDIRTLIMREALIDELRYLNEQAAFNFLIITGDISDKGKGYDKAKELIESIVNVISLPSERVFMVPGNHDIDRNIPSDRGNRVKELWDKDILSEGEEASISELLLGQDEFFKTYEQILGRKYPVDKVHFVHELDNDIAIIHLNTSWMCYDSELESGKLHIGLYKLYNCLDDPCLSSKNIKIVIGHHRLDDFNKSVESSIKSIFRSRNIDLYMGGHCHEANASYDSQINTEFCSCRQARAGVEHYPAGFIIGEIDTESDQSFYQFYNWDVNRATWTYDYSVESAKHGKYYMKSGKFTKQRNKCNVIVDLKLFGPSLNYNEIMESFNLHDSLIYSTSIRDFRPQTQTEWHSCLKELENLYIDVIKSSGNKIHIFPIGSIPLLVSFGCFLQNDSSNVKIYQYFENNSKWVFDESKDNLNIKSDLKKNGAETLAVILNVSAVVNENDIKDVLKTEYDTLTISIEEPKLSALNYNGDVLRVKRNLKENLDKIYNKYNEIHLFLAAPAGLCVEVGRIIREHMYPDTYIYNFSIRDTPKYKQIFNLKKIREIRCR